MKRLIRVSVQGLLGQYHHEFDFPMDHEFVILHGPNGVGKTRLLELISDSLSPRTPSPRTPFDSLKLEFDDDSWLKVSRRDRRTTWATSESGRIGDQKSGVDDDRRLLAAARDLMEQGLIRRFSTPGTGGLRPFRDGETGERLSAEEAIERYSAELAPEKSPVPQQVRDFVATAPAILVEVNRLRVIEEEPPRPRSGFIGESTQIAAIDFYARDLARRITIARAEHAVAAQQLDGSYPSRLLRGSTINRGRLGVSNLQAQLESLRSKLERAALLESAPGLTELDALELEDDWKIAALQLHYQDSLDKLRRLEGLADRILLFHDLVASKLSGKVMRLHSEQGYVFETPGGAVPARDLSSGEQHEVVMIYRLIFESARNQLVLIDEPEVSLHVKWQRQFLDDLIRIAKLDGLRFVVATHSPQIVGTWTKRMISLGHDAE